MNHYSYTKTDLLSALCLSLFVLIIAACRLTAGYSVWDDDPSAYMNEGIAISEGRFWEQAEINYYYHPSQLPKEVKNNQLIYVWGYPLLLAIVNRFVEFDRALYGSIIFYKIPNVICAGLLGGIAFLFFRRRFSAFIAVNLSLLLSLNLLITGTTFAKSWTMPVRMFIQHFICAGAALPVFIIIMEFQNTHSNAKCRAFL